MNETISTQTIVLSALAVVTAYLAGSIPFAYLIARWKGGFDIRKVGSGNVGATNVGRLLGFRYFLLVLALDLLKGFLPTLLFPLALGRLAGKTPADLPVLVALAAILGHTFPIYLKFRGGKGVATSLGCVLALDPVSSGVAAAVFVGVLFVTRFVSLSSLAGGLAFVLAHFVRQPTPLARDQLAMSLFAVGVLALLIVLHRKNLARIRAGTENRVNLRWPGHKPSGQPHASGRISLWIALGLLALSVSVLGAFLLHQQAVQPIERDAGPWRLREIDRASTGQQRVDRIAFAAGGNRLAATCPRYGHVVIYEIGAQKKLKLIKEIELEGRPIAVAAISDRFLVLERPAGDQRHLEPGWWETFDLDGERRGGRNVAGYYPDDLAVSPDGKYVFILSSGQCEGDSKKPLPALEVVALGVHAAVPRTVGKLTFAADSDPERLTLSVSARCAAVLLAKTNECAAIDLSTPESPRLIGRTKLPARDVPYISHSQEADWIIMPVAGPSEAVALDFPGSGQASEGMSAARPVSRGDYLLCTRQRESVLELFQTKPSYSLGKFPLKGPLNIGRTRPSGLSYSPERGLLAVATRSGMIHLIELLSRVRPGGSQPPQVARSQPAVLGGLPRGALR